ncbi:MAG TPA: response regulator [Bryobacteraceae bacterium]
MNPAGGTGTILVAEDELDVLCYFDMALRSFGYNVETAQDGDELLSSLRASRSEVLAVLLDIFMPNRDGLETLREIRRFYPTMPVIVVSGAASPQHIVTAIKVAQRTSYASRSRMMNWIGRFGPRSRPGAPWQTPRCARPPPICPMPSWEEAPE